MKSKIFALLLVTVSLFSCRKETITAPNKNQNSTETILTGVGSTSKSVDGKPIPMSLPWRIGSLLIDGKDVTGYFRSFGFEFRNDNTVTAIAIDGKKIIYGKWYMIDKEHLFLSFGTSGLRDDEMFNYLSSEWTILNQSLTSISLESNDSKIHKQLRFDRKPGFSVTSAPVY